MKIQRKTQLDSEIPTASMPDIIFMLLVFFMVTTVLKEYSGLPVNLPKAKRIEKLKSKNIRLGLDAIAGKNTQVLANFLSENGVIGNYGLLSGKSCQLSPHDIVFRNISLRGIWLSQWLKGHNSNKRSRLKVYNELVEYILKAVSYTHLTLPTKA